MGELFGGVLIIGLVASGFLRVFKRVRSRYLRVFLAAISAYVVAIVLAGFGMADGGPWAGGLAAEIYFLPALIVLGAGGFFYGSKEDPDPAEPFR